MKNPEKQEEMWAKRNPKASRPSWYARTRPPSCLQEMSGEPKEERATQFEIKFGSQPEPQIPNLIEFQDQTESQNEDLFEVRFEDPSEPQLKDLTEPQLKDPTEPQLKDPTEPQLKDPTEPQVKDPTEPQVKDPTEPQLENPIELQLEEVLGSQPDPVGTQDEALPGRDDGGAALPLFHHNYHATSHQPTEFCRNPREVPLL